MMTEVLTLMMMLVPPSVAAVVAKVMLGAAAMAVVLVMNTLATDNFFGLGYLQLSLLRFRSRQLS